MNKEFAWFLGYLLSDGSIKDKSSGNINFICKDTDAEILEKVKSIIGTKCKIHIYSDYKSPQARLRVSDRKDIPQAYPDIKTKIPEEDIKGYERHFIRGLIDGDGTLSVRNRKYGAFRLGFIDEYEQITKWVTEFLVKKLGLPEKRYRYVPQNHVWEVVWEGTMAQLIAWYLYHGDIEHCCLKRKHEKYKSAILHNKEFNSIYDEMIYAVKAEKNDSWINFKQYSSNSLKWCHLVQKILPYNTTPVFKNPGRRKYYNLWIPKNISVINTQDMQEYA